MSSSFVFREYDVPEPLRVELQGDDAPFGRMEEEAGFSSGGEVVRKKVKLPGRRTPLFHVFYADDRPLVVRGRFVDYRMGRGHAKALRALIERVRERGNLLRVIWDGDQWEGLLAETEFGHEDKGYITYELTFDVGKPPDVGAARAAPRPLADSDALARVLAKLRARPEKPAFSRSLMDALDSGLTALEDALGAFQDAVRSAEVAREGLSAQVRRVSSLGAQVMEQAQVVQDVFDNTTADAAGIVQSFNAIAEWATYSTSMSSFLREVRGTARDAVEAARVRERATERLYVCRNGDTLESIARTELGDASRAGELGLMDADLAPGRVLRLPAASGSV